jgi:hypothetical protein
VWVCVCVCGGSSRKFCQFGQQISAFFVGETHSSAFHVHREEVDFFCALCCSSVGCCTLLPGKGIWILSTNVFVMVTIVTSKFMGYVELDAPFS